MPERPLLVLPVPGVPTERKNKPSGRSRTKAPTRGRQGERLSPQFTVLQTSFDNQQALVRTEATGLVPEQVIVLETAAPVADFIVAVRNIEGLEWLGEIEEKDLPPNDDFFVLDRAGERTEKSLSGRMFLVFSNHQALTQMLGLWRSWQENLALPRGFAKWGNLFSMLRTVRTWGVQDRLTETGALEDWRERVTHAQQIVPCEIELWFRNDPQRRRAAAERVSGLVRDLGGQIVHEASIEEITFHALLVRLPMGAIQDFLNAAGDAALVQCEQIQFFRAAGQMSAALADGEQVTQAEIPAPVQALGTPVVALFDGLPLQSHQRLTGRLVIDDPDNIELTYQANERRHGTAMASLIVHGDLSVGGQPLSRQLYVRPILRPDPLDWRNQPRSEIVSEDVLIVDLVHRAVRRLFEGEGEVAAVAPNICAINLSIGIRDRLFDGALTPLARLIDWLSWRYRVLFVVSAGNHSTDIELSIDHDDAGTLTAEDRQELVIRAIAADARNRRLLSPAEAMNAISVGAIHSDGSTAALAAHNVSPFVGQDLPSVINAQGMGYRRAIKPEAFLPGGRVTLTQRLERTPKARFSVLRNALAPGQQVACPGVAGDVRSIWHSRGTSNAAALATRTISQHYDVLEELRQTTGAEVIDLVPKAVWLKSMLLHGASWGSAGDLLSSALRTRGNGRQFKEYLTRLLGYGQVDGTRVAECTPHRVTALSGGQIQAEQGHIHRFPLPPSLSGKIGWRRLAITLAWLSPVNPMHQSWRRADLWFSPPSAPLQVDRKEADWRAVQRGTVQHEILEGSGASAFVDGDHLEIHVSCRPDAGALEESIPYALVATLEVAEEMGIDIYNEVRVRIPAGRVQVTT